MSSAAPGSDTSSVEVTNISARGFQLRLGGEDLFVGFSEFPWFQAATIQQITNVCWLGPNHLYWPELDIDLAVDSIRRPGAYPLVSRVRA